MPLPLPLKSISTLFLLCFPLFFSFAQIAPVKQWDNSFGGIRSDDMYVIIETNDGGYLLGGDSDSPIGGQKSQGSQGFNDYWIVKTDSAGNKIWDRRFGGNKKEEMFDVIQTADHGYLIGGSSLSTISGDQTQVSRGERDFWIVKTDQFGNKQWDKRYGSAQDDVLRSMILTNDGGFILGGESLSGAGGEKTEPSMGQYDVWVVKTDANGNIEWDESYGGTDNDRLNAIQETAGGGFIIGSWTISPVGFDVSQPGKGLTDMWLLRIAADGTKLWDKRYGGSDNEYLYALDQTGDGGFVLAGYTRSEVSGDVTVAGKGEYDFWIVKTDVAGNMEWDQRLGGALDDKGKSIYEISDGSYVVGGWSESDAGGDKSTDSKGGTDYWLAGLDAAGNKLWDLDLGGGDEERLHDVPQTADGGFIIGGHSNSGKNGDKSQFNVGLSDYWIVKLSPATTAALYYADADSDGYGNPAIDSLAASQPTGYVNNNSDCNDADENIHPLAVDYCNSIDDNCNGLTDENAIMATIDPEGIIEVCKGIKVMLTANSGTDLTYQWIRNAVSVPNATNSTFTTSQQGDFQVMETNAFNCVSTSVASTIKTLSKPDAIISPQGNLDICETGSVVLQANTGSNLAYQWKKNGSTINGATNSAYTATAPAAYKVGVSKNNGCKQTSESVTVVKSCRLVTPDDNMDENPVSIFPNPGDGAFVISFESECYGNAYQAEMKLLSLPGSVLYAEKVPYLTGPVFFNIPEHLLPANGLYLLQVRIVESGSQLTVATYTRQVVIHQ